MKAIQIVRAVISRRGGFPVGLCDFENYVIATHLPTGPRVRHSPRCFFHTNLVLLLMNFVFQLTCVAPQNRSNYNGDNY